MTLPGQALWQWFRERPLWRHPWVSWLGALGAAGLGLGLVLYATWNWGPGANSDGLSYLVLARYIQRAGIYGYPYPDGTWKIMGHFPPGYPLLIAALLPWAGDEATAALWVNLLSLAAVVLLTTREVYRATHHAFPTLATAFWVAAAFPLVRIFAWVLSEAPFLALMLLISWAVEAWTRTWSRRRGLLVGLLAAWAVYVRWMGVVFLLWVTLLAGYAGWRTLRGRWSAFLRELTPFWVAAAGPIGMLFAATRLASGALASRAVRWHPPTQETWLQAVQTVNAWVSSPFVEFEPEQALRRALGLLGLLALLTLLALRREAPSLPGEASSPTAGFLFRWWAFVGAYILTLVGAITFMDASTPMDWRLLAPVFLALSLVAGVALWQGLGPWWPTALLVAWVWFHLLRTYKVTHELYLTKWHRGGAVLRTEAWQEADVWPVLRSLPEEVALYTNEDIETRYYADRPLWLLPPRPRWIDGRAYFCDVVRNECLPAPYTYRGEWLERLAERTRGQCAVISLITLNAPPRHLKKVRNNLRELQKHFILWQTLESAYLLRTPRCPPGMFSPEP